MFLARCVLSLSAQRAPCSLVGGIQGPEFFLTLTQTRLPSEGCGRDAGFHTGSTGMVPKEAPSILHPITDVYPTPIDTRTHSPLYWCLRGKACTLLRHLLYKYFGNCFDIVICP